MRTRQCEISLLAVAVTAISVVHQPCRAEVILPFGSSWEYLHPTDGVDPAIADPDFATTWHTLSEYDGIAFSGPAPAMLGYQNFARASIETNILTPASGNRYSAYFRTTITTTLEHGPLLIEIVADDGGVLYIDGEAVSSFNYWGADVYTGLATIPILSPLAKLVVIDGLQAGTHVIAYSLHNGRPSSSDLAFDLQIAEVDPAPTPVPALENLVWTSTNGEVSITGSSMDKTGVLEIPDTIDGMPVTSIGAGAFRESRWRSISLPEGVTSIGDSAFSDCTGLLNVSLPDSVAKIGESAFSTCVSLTEVCIPDGVTSIGSQAFYRCESLTDASIPFGVSRVETSVFRYCANLVSVSLPEGVTSIAGSAFSDCFSLMAVNFPDSLTSIGNRAFNGCANLTTDGLGPSIESIGMFAFEGTAVTLEGDGPLKYLTHPTAAFLVDASAATGSLVLPQEFEGLPVLSINAFANNQNVTCVTIPDSVTSIGATAFSSCGSLTQVTIPDSVTSIGAAAFSSCFSLTAVNIPDTVTSIGASAFSGCFSLTAVTIPDSVTSIGASAFSGCGSLTQVNIPHGVASIDPRMFADCTSLTDVDIPATITSIGNSAFWGCSSLTEVSIPDSVTSIEYSTFNGCANLAAVELGLGIESIGFAAFEGTAVALQGDGPLKYLTNPTAAFLVDASAASGDLVLPPDFEGLPVRSINAFFNNQNVTRVTIPDSVTSIGIHAFAFCDNLLAVTIPDSVTNIEAFAFSANSLAIVIFGGAQPEAETNSFSGIVEAVAYVQPEHLASFGGDQAIWNGLVVRSDAFAEIVELNLVGDSFAIRFSGVPFSSTWKIMGSPSLENFEDDLTSASVVTEFEPGDYEAVIDTAGKPTPYFFRIER